jgi:hypothetical protein
MPIDTPICASTEAEKKAFYRTIIECGVISPIPPIVLVIGTPGSSRVSSLRAAVAEATHNSTRLNTVIVYSRRRIESICGGAGPNTIVFVRDSVDDLACALMRDNPSMPVALFGDSEPSNTAV